MNNVVQMKFWSVSTVTILVVLWGSYFLLRGQPAKAHKKFEYMARELGNLRENTDMLRQAGDDGWELVFIYDCGGGGWRRCFYFKREKR